MLITFSGLDGAGKSTLIESLREELRREGRRVTVLHLNDHVGVYAWLRAVRDRVTGRARTRAAGPEPLPRMEPLPTPLGRLRDAILWSKTPRRLLYPIDLLCFLGIRFYCETVRRRILIMDRYFYDRLVDVAGPRKQRVGWALLRLLARITPVPDVAVWLSVTPEEAFARKGEYTIPYLRNRSDSYRRVFELAPSALQLSSRDVAGTREAVARAVRDRLDARAPRLSLEALRVLLDKDAVLPPLARREDWTELLTLAQEGGVLVRLAAELEARREPLPARFIQQVDNARIRSTRVAELAQRLSENCARIGLPHAFLKTVERYPDTGHDVDFLLSATSAGVDRLVLRGIPALRRARKLPHRLSGSACYLIDGMVLDIAHARVGRLGEHARYAYQLLGRATPTTLGATLVLAPTIEDHFILLALQQAYARAAFRIADVLWAIRTLRERSPDWHYLAFTASALGLSPAVGSYLSYVDQIHMRLCGQPLLAGDVLAQFGLRGRHRSRARLGGDGYRFPAPRLAGELYFQQLRSTLRSGRWVSAARLCLLPMMALVASLRRAA